MKTALVIIDMQMLMQHRIEAGRDHVNGDAAGKIAALARSFREKGRAVIHIRHRDGDTASPLHPNAPGFQSIACVRELESEPVFIKTTSSGFASTELESYLRANAITDLVVTGAVAGFCVNSTVRAGADLGFRMCFVRDAVIGFDLPGESMSARTIFDVTIAHLKADFADIVETSDLLSAG
ncbi:isochorismatase family protein [Rhizobium tumorigenes]|uniref:isochorismatase family protein n=1 Tax=Rhizobium tumorigenes TaxID=2041385 RepID=UPI00241C430C|nr:isochorismatase family protein [Rhizobium tumorigenes]WFS00899.1 isochorismatase family protein [Rhizobium tumorigenes]